MCKALDDVATISGSSSSSHSLVAPQQQQQQQQQRQQPLVRPKRRVRFEPEHNQTFQLPLSTPDEQFHRWFSGQDYQQMRWDIGTIVRGKALGLDLPFFSTAAASSNPMAAFTSPDNIYCYRGLEFLKVLDPYANGSKNGNNSEAILSRKERRLAYAKNVMVFQQLMHHKQKQVQVQQPQLSGDERQHQHQQDDQTQQLLGAYCTQLSRGAQERAQALAEEDANDARHVYKECHLIYYDIACQQSERGGGLIRREVSMFPPSLDDDDDSTARSLLCRDSVHPAEDSFQDVLSRVFFGRGGLFATTRVH